MLYDAMNTFCLKTGASGGIGYKMDKTAEMQEKCCQIRPPSLVLLCAPLTNVSPSFKVIYMVLGLDVWCMTRFDRANENHCVCLFQKDSAGGTDCGKGHSTCTWARKKKEAYSPTPGTSESWTYFPKVVGLVCQVNHTLMMSQRKFSVH